MEIIKMELTERQANLIAYLSSREDAIEILIKSKVFDHKKGSKIIHYDDNGKIRKIETHTIENY